MTGIPKLFHWIWFGPAPLPEQHRRWMDGWLALHPGWEHIVWTDSTRHRLINEAQFQLADTFAQKADIARYELVHRHGGIYLDTDMECLRSIEPLLVGVEAFIAAEEPNSLQHLGIGILGATRGHPWLAELIAKLPQAMESGVGIRQQTGPLFATSQTIGRPDVTIFPERLFRHVGRAPFAETCAVHHGAVSWGETERVKHEAELRQLVTDDIEPVVPPGTLSILVNKGWDLPVSGGRRYVPFPDRNGQWAGYPADDAAAIAELERLRHAGAKFIVFPALMFYWLDTYRGLKEYLNRQTRCVCSNERAMIFELNGDRTRIPERSEDVEALWNKAAPLTAETFPVWGVEDTGERYRYLGLATTDELKPLEDAGLAIDGNRIYIPGPRESAVWSIGIATGDSPLALACGERPVLTRHDVTDVPAAFVADPFMLRRDGRWFMFFEIMNWQVGRGQIGLAESDNGMDWTYRGVVLAESFHLSYPYVFEWDGRYYMIPETHEVGSVRLYEASCFPTGWRHAATLLEGEYFADASIFRWEETWWLFVETSSGKKNDTLRLYHANELTGPWVEHSRGPIVHGDSRIARPGGRVTVCDDRIYRYAQNCFSDYGREVVAFEVTALSPTRYEEHTAGVILRGSGCGWNARGMHQIDPHPLGDGRWIACVDGWTAECGWTEMPDARADVQLGLMRRDVQQCIPRGASVLVVDKGRRLLPAGMPFPERDGKWAGYPADDAAAIAELERQRQAGAEFIVFPASMSYWFETYEGLRLHLEKTARCVLNNERVSIFDLKGNAA